MSVIHPDDAATIEKLHTDATNKINDQLLTFQDESYALGLARGIKQGEALRGELLEAVERLVQLNMPLTGNPTHEQLVEFWQYEKSVGRGEADDQLFVLEVIDRAKAVQP